MAEDLRRAAENKQWQLDWQSIDVHLQRAEAAVAQQDHAVAVAQYSHGLRSILYQLRNNLTRPDDSETVL